VSVCVCVCVCVYVIAMGQVGHVGVTGEVKRCECCSPGPPATCNTEFLAGSSNIRLEGMGNQGAKKMGQGKTIEAFINQKIRTEEAGYHLQRDNERLGMRPPMGPDIPSHAKPPAPSPQDVASERLANVRKIVEEQFAKYENPDLPAEYQAEVAKAKARIVSRFQEADDRVRKDDVAGATSTTAKEEERTATQAPPPPTSFTFTEWLLLVAASGGLLLASVSHTLWQKRNDREFARQLRARAPEMFACLQSLGWPHVDLD
jgi:hypothetical protein